VHRDEQPAERTDREVAALARVDTISGGVRRAVDDAAPRLRRDAAAEDPAEVAARAAELRAQRLLRRRGRRQRQRLGAVATIGRASSAGGMSSAKPLALVSALLVPVLPTSASSGLIPPGRGGLAGGRPPFSGGRSRRAPASHCGVTSTADCANDVVDSARVRRSSADCSFGVERAELGRDGGELVHCH